MSYPKSFKNEPTKVEAEAGKTYAWCTCGLSENNPFCNGSHKKIEEGTFTSQRFTVEETSEIWLCNCKQTKNPPYCDGSHKSIANT
jgi:CDGSH-type Zn-finger protein